MPDLTPLLLQMTNEKKVLIICQKTCNVFRQNLGKLANLNYPQKNDINTVQAGIFWLPF